MIKRVVINMIILLHYAMVYSSQVIFDKLIEWRRSYKKSYDYVHKPRYIKPGRDTTGRRDTLSDKRNTYGFPIQSKTK